MGFLWLSKLDFGTNLKIIFIYCNDVLRCMQWNWIKGFDKCNCFIRLIITSRNVHSSIQITFMGHRMVLTDLVEYNELWLYLVYYSYVFLYIFSDSYCKKYDWRQPNGFLLYDQRPTTWNKRGFASPVSWKYNNMECQCSANISSSERRSFYKSC